VKIGAVPDVSHARLPRHDALLPGARKLTDIHLTSVHDLLWTGRNFQALGIASLQGRRQSTNTFNEVWTRNSAMMFGILTRVKGLVSGSKAALARLGT
jgi:hypothetical protein